MCSSFPEWRRQQLTKPTVVNLVSHQLAVGSSEAAFCNEAEAHQLAVGSEAAFRNEAEAHQLAVDGATVEDTTVEDTTDSNVEDTTRVTGLPFFPKWHDDKMHWQDSFPKWLDHLLAASVQRNKSIQEKQDNQRTHNQGDQFDEGPSEAHKKCLAECEEFVKVAATNERLQPAGKSRKLSCQVTTTTDSESDGGSVFC